MDMKEYLKELLSNEGVERWRRPFASMTDKNLDILSGMVRDEEEKRLQMKIDAGDFPPINEDEMALLVSNTKIRAVQAYKERTKESLRVAMGAINLEVEKMKERGQAQMKMRDGE